MKNSMLCVAFTSLLLAGTTDAAAFAKSKDPRIGEKVDRACFARSIDGFTNTNKKSVVLSAGPSKEFYVETGSCFQLRHAKRIGIGSTGSCLSRGDRLIVSEDMFPNGATLPADRCIVKAIYKWDKNAGKGEEENPTDETAKDE